MRGSREFSITRRTRARFFFRSPAASICDSFPASSSRSRFRWATKRARVPTRSRRTPKTAAHSRFASIASRAGAASDGCSSGASATRSISAGRSAPSRSSARRMLKRALASSSREGAPPKIHLIYAAPDREHLLYAAELEELARTASNFSYETVIAPPEKIYDRLFELAQARWVIGDADRTRQFYICGVGKGVIRLRDLIRGAGYERRAVHYEQW